MIVGAYLIAPTSKLLKFLLLWCNCHNLHAILWNGFALIAEILIQNLRIEIDFRNMKFLSKTDWSRILDGLKYLLVLLKGTCKSNRLNAFQHNLYIHRCWWQMLINCYMNMNQILWSFGPLWFKHGLYSRVARRLEMIFCGRSKNRESIVRTFNSTYYWYRIEVLIADVYVNVFLQVRMMNDVYDFNTSFD